jgi:phage-related protein (TIGR01555 family)
MSDDNKKESRTDRMWNAAQALGRLDGWVNALTGLGSARDKRTGHTPGSAIKLSTADCDALWTSSDTAKRIVDIPAEEMTRQGFDIHIPDEPEQAEKIGAKLSDLKFDAKLLDLTRKQRAFGGAIMLVGADDNAIDLSIPLNEKAIRDVNFLTVFDPSEFSVLEYSGAIVAADYGEPLIYAINPRIISGDATSSQVLSRVHSSRVIRLSMPVLTRLTLQVNRGVGDSVYESVWQTIRDFDSSYSNAGALVEDFAQAVFKIKGLAEAIASDKANLIRDRLAMMDYSRSVMRGIALDADSEDFERKPTPLSGLSELLDRFANRLAAASRIPVTILMGQAPAGLSATGDADTRAFFDHIKSLQTRDHAPVIERLTKLIMLSAAGPTRKAEPENWAVQFRPLWQEPDSEKATMRKAVAETDQIYMLQGVLSADEVRENRFGGDEYRLETSVEKDEIDPEETDDLNEAEGTPRVDPETGEPVQVMPGKTLPGAAPSGSGAPKLQDTALNGAQITSAVEIVKSVGKGELSRESGAAMLSEFFNLTPEVAERILGPKTFKPEPSAQEIAMVEKAKNPPPMPGAPAGQPKPNNEPPAKPGQE